MDAPASTHLETAPVRMGALTSNLGFMLRMAQLVAYGRLFRDLEDGALLPGEFSTLWVISLNPEIRQGDVASALNIKRAHMTKLVKRLEAKGFISRRVSPEDRRATLLRLTPTGESRLTAESAFYLDSDTAKSSGLTEKEYDTLLTLLAKFSGHNREA